MAISRIFTHNRKPGYAWWFSSFDLLSNPKEFLIRTWIQANTTANTEIAQSKSLETPSENINQSQDNQTKFEDTTTVVVQTTTNKFDTMYSNINPYPDDTPTGIVTRTIQIKKITWGPSFAYEWFDILDTMCSASQQIADVLGKSFFTDLFQSGMYRYLRCKFRLTVKINSTPFHQGALMCTWAPPHLPVNMLIDPVLASQLHTTVVSASLQEEATIEIPYISPHPHIDLLDYTAKSGPVFGLVTLNQITTSSSGISDSVPVTIFAQIVDPKLYGYLEKPDPSFKNKILESQSSNDRQKHKHLKEADSKQKSGLTAQSIVETIEPVIKNVPFLSPVLNLGAKILDNLDKPTNDSAVTYFIPRANRGFNHVTGLSQAERLTALPQAAVTKDLSMESSDMTVIQYAQRPALMDTYVSTSAGVISQIDVHPMIYTTTIRTDPDYLAFATSMFSYWRGSTKYLFQFVGTAFYSGRYRFSVSNTINAPTTIDEATGYFNRVVDVKGDTWVEITIPYLRPHTWEYSDPDLRNPIGGTFLVVEALTDVQGSSLPADAKYFINVYRAAGEDFQLAQLRKSTNITIPSEKVLESQTSLIDRFKKPFPGICEGSSGQQESGLLMSETSTTMTDLGKRYVDHVPVTHKSFPGETSTQISSRQPAHWLMYGFLYWRGSRRIASQSGASAYMGIQPTSDSTSTPGDGVHLYLVPSDGFYEVEVPWFCIDAFYPTVASADPATLLLSAWEPTDIIQTVFFDSKPHFLAYGDDFVLLFPVPCRVSSLPAAAPRAEVPVKRRDNLVAHPRQGRTNLNSTTTTTTTLTKQDTKTKAS